MKKSRSVRLVLLGSAGLTLAGCDQGPPPSSRFFPDADACAAAYDEGTCRSALAQSQATFAEEAPRFTDKQACEAEFGEGNCESRDGAQGGSFFVPMLMGYMVGRAFSQPVYRGPNNQAMMRSSGRLYRVGQFIGGTGRTASFKPGQVTQVRRGGFGTTARSYGTSSGS
ncbi:MAG: DUF1190 domain-containing protein [Rhodospirillales bacterium]